MESKRIRCWGGAFWGSQGEPTLAFRVGRVAWESEQDAHGPSHCSSLGRRQSRNDGEGWPEPGPLGLLGPREAQESTRNSVSPQRDVEMTELL